MSVSKLKKYINEQPEKPEGLQLKTPILVSDSKGFTLRNNCLDYEFPLELWCLSSARTKELVDIIDQRIEKAIKRHGHIILYIWSGTCDISSKIGKYIEIRSKNFSVVDRVIEQYHRAIGIVNSEVDGDDDDTTDSEEEDALLSQLPEMPL
ncbi:Hypothetical predicted protein [Mytilus galloprovincialis]|uniref:Uncharacterized protein n=1 Tax=Mytilus galloprovincialis TaxID=29158 RepID=A0A8B6G5M5_MYTGA|nr:Hypothetical predicted protein [Mytilus galloprovincialis]